MQKPLVDRQEFRWSIRKKGKHVLNICTQYVGLHALAVMLMATTSTVAFANPTGGTVTSGSATISSAGSEVDINQTTNRAIINWGSFDISNGETTKFIQPGTNSVTLNRVTTTGQASSIDGNLLANGHVFVINPNGVLIGQHGNVDVAGFVASSADVDDASFMSGASNMQFNKAGNANAVVENQGHVTIENAGLGLLVAPTVKNSGVIEGNLATLQMGAGDTFGVDLYGDGLLNLAVASTGSPRSLNATNTGKIIASGGKVVMTAAAASSMVDSVINTSGVVSATSLVAKGGEIILTGTGAHVKVAGKVDASGKTGGGSIKIGGALHGAAGTEQAATVDVDSSAVVTANATDNGDGGDATVWSTLSSTVAGVFEAKGGANGGNGGIVETSSEGALDVAASHVDATAAKGANGDWLIDPTTLNVDATLANTINNSVSNVTLSTTDGLQFSANIDMKNHGVGLSATSTGGSIQMANSFIRTAGGDLTMIAKNGDITINGAGGTKVVFTNGGDINFLGNTISITNATIGSNGGNITMTALSTAGGKTLSINSSSVSTTGPTCSHGTASGAACTQGIELNQNGTQTTSVNGSHDNTGAQTAPALTIDGNNNQFYTDKTGGKLTLTGKDVGGNSNCFAAGSTNCIVGDPIGSIAVTVTADPKTKVYGSADPSLTYTLSGGTILAGDTLNGSLTRAAGENVGSYAITQGTAFYVTGAYYSYVVTYVGNNLTITPANLTVTAGSLSKAYGQTVDVNTAGYTTSGSLFFGDTISGVTLASAGAAASANTGNYAITASNAAFSHGLASNYNITYVNGNLAVTAANLTITAANEGKTYGQTFTFDGSSGAHEYTVTGLQGTDSVSSVNLSSTGATGTAGIGDYSVIASGAAGTGLGNYTITYVDGNLHISPAALTILANSGTKVYGQTYGFTGNEFTTSGLVNGDTVTSETLSSAGSAVTAGVGNYGITGSNAVGTGLSNYTITYQSGNLAVTPKALTITANSDSKTYGSAYSFNGTEFSASGLINGDTVTSESLTSTGAPATAGVGNYAIVGSNAVGTGLGNYTISYVNGNLLVNAKALTILANSGTKVYGQTYGFNGTEFTTTGLVNGDTVTSETLSSAGSAVTAGVGNYGITGSNAVGTGLGNYTITYQSGNLAVTPKALTITANSDSKTYGSAYSFTGHEYTTSGLINGDTVTSESLTSTGAPATAGVGNYAIVGSNAVGTGLGNYTISYVNGNLLVNAKALTITANSGTKVYGQTYGFTGNEFTTSGLVNGDTVTSETLTSTGSAATAGVGNYGITGSNAVGTGLGNYTITYNSGNLAVTPKALTITANSGSKTYGQTYSFTGNEFTTSGLVNSDTVTSESLTSTGAPATAGVGNYAIVGSNAVGSGLGNYTISYVNGNLLVNAKALTITANSGTKVYGQSYGFTGTEFTTSGLVNGDTVTSETLSSTGAPVTAGVGNYGITGSNAVGTGLGNYTITYNSGNLAVTPKALTITANSGSKTYGQTYGFTGSEFTTSGLINGDTVTSESLTSTGAPATAGVGNYAIVGSNAVGTGLGNYTISYVNGNLLVNAKALTILANSGTKVYGQTYGFNGTEFTTTGLVNGDTVTSETLSSAGSAVTAGVGNYGITGSNAVGTGLGNYTITYQSGNLAVTPKALTITANSGSKTYGDTYGFTGHEYTTSGLINGDTVTSESLTSTGAPATAGVGNYAIVGSNAVGTGLGNYTISYVNGNLLVNPKALTITANNAGKTYGTTKTFAGTEFTTSGLVNGDTVTSETLTSTGAPAAASVGSYDIVGSNAVGTGLGNYTISYVNGTLTVGNVILTITANSGTKTYGQTYSFGGTEFTVSGLLNGDTVTGETLSSTGSAGTAGVGNYAIVGSNATGTGLGNYTIVYVNGNLAVTPKALFITANSDTKVYGDTHNYNGTEFTTSGLINGDTVTSETITSGGSAATAGVGNYAVTGSNAAGTGLGNYSITYYSGNLAVTPKTLTITANSGSKVYGDVYGLTGTAFTTSGLVNGDTVTSETLASTGSAATAGVGNYAITGSNAVGSGLGNYTISYVDGNLAVTPKALTITANSGSKTYGDTYSFDGSEFTTSGLVNGDTVDSETLASTGSAATAGVGNYDITGSNASGTGLGNYTITYVNGNLAVGAKALTITANSGSKVYGDGYSFDGSEFTTSGLVNGDTVDSETLSSTGSAVTAGVGNYAIAGSGATGTGLGNYTITYVDGNLAVTPKALTVTADNQTKTYGDSFSFNGSEYTTDGLVNGDTVSSVDLSSAGAPATANAGFYSIDGANAAGTGLSNYTISYVAGTFTVNKKGLTITADDQTKDYGKTFTFDGTEYHADGLVNGDVIGPITITSDGAPASANPGTYDIIPSAPGGGGGEGGIQLFAACDGQCNNVLNNYDVTYVNGTMTIPQVVNAPFVQIDPLGRPIISVSNQAIVYDPSFENYETLTLNTDVSIKDVNPGATGGTSAGSLANLEPAAGGDDDKKSAEDLANVEPAAGGNGSGGTPAANGDVNCANDFLDNKSCPQPAQ